MTLQNIILRSNNNITYTLYTTDDLYKKSSLINSLNNTYNNDDNNDNDITIDIPFKCNIFNIIRKCNININNIFILSTEEFIDMYNFLLFILYEHKSDIFICNCINYIVTHNITNICVDLLNNEAQNMNNYLNKVSMDIQIQQTSLLFYKTVLYREKNYEYIIKHNRKDIYDYNKKLYNINSDDNEMYMYYEYITIYNNKLTDEIKQTRNYAEYTDYLSDKLCDACENNNINEIKLLLKNKIEFNYDNSIEEVILENKPEIIKLLLENEPELIRIFDMYLYGIMDIKYTEMIKVLFQYGINFNYEDNNLTILMNICDNNKIDILLFLLDKNADWYDIVKSSINICTDNDESVLYYACKNEHIEIVKILLSHSAICNCKELFISIQNDHINIVKLLISNGFDVNTTDDYDNITSLIIASIYGKYDIVKYLLENGADINMMDNNNYTAKRYALDNDDIDIVNLISLYEKI